MLVFAYAGNLGMALEGSIVKVTKTSRPVRVLSCACLLMTITAGARAGETLLMEDFDGYPLDTSIWGLATWNIGDRTQFGNSPVFGSEPEVDNPLLSVNFISLPLDTWNPNLPGQRVLGTEIYSLQKFDNTGGIEYLARARLSTAQRGLVAA